jgi:hypothetical protein
MPFDITAFVPGPGLESSRDIATAGVTVADYIDHRLQNVGST